MERNSTASKASKASWGSKTSKKSKEEIAQDKADAADRKKMAERNASKEKDLWYNIQKVTNKTKLVK
jgi:hypothetical protein